MSNKVAKIVTEKILDRIDSENELVWQRGWNIAGWETDSPQNPDSGTIYSGFNSLVLYLTMLDEGYSSPYFVTYNGAKNLGLEVATLDKNGEPTTKSLGHVKRGESGHKVTFFKIIEKETDDLDENGNPVIEYIPLLRYFTVFNIEQCAGINQSKLPHVEKPEGIDFSPIEKAENLLDLMQGKIPEITHRGTKAFYRPSTDEIVMPLKESFKNEEEYYLTLFHEIAHSTGHKSRLDRSEIKETGIMLKDSYSKEELTAEMTACMLGHMCGINAQNHIDNSAAYLAGWAKNLADTPSMIIRASNLAEKAMNYLILESENAQD